MLLAIFLALGAIATILLVCSFIPRFGTLERLFFPFAAFILLIVMAAFVADLELPFAKTVPETYVVWTQEIGVFNPATNQTTYLNMQGENSTSLWMSDVVHYYPMWPLTYLFLGLGLVMIVKSIYEAILILDERKQKRESGERALY